MAASARPGPQFIMRRDFDLQEWERQHVEAETQTLRYTEDQRAQHLAAKHDLADKVAEHTIRQAYRYF